MENYSRANVDETNLQPKDKTSTNWNSVEKHLNRLYIII